MARRIAMEPYRKRVAEVIEEEFCQQGFLIRNLPEPIQEALKNIERRLANDLEYATLPKPLKGHKK